ncbi:hypothetical protein T265_08063 [Opisthorchis viverrini]|uniref:Uncharacterized protein n=1 Tax=Opisthorchis viverrini TaxID=6198 RepID=A0A074ZF14_OPIVI|nr:hypothetical protein T265_08063 [Opisthorchis viverrini]KER24217.1 hypothetical protein T265_08063 [Opisthorchis viverrini]
MLLVFNVVVILCGIGLMVAGGIAEYNVAKYLSKDVIELHAFVIFIIAFGGLLTITGIFGFVGACMKSVCLLTFYIILLVIFILGGIAAAIAGLILKDKVLDYVDKVLEETYRTYGDSVSKRVIDLVQKELECCGPDGTWPAYLQQPPPASCFSPSGDLYVESCVCALDDYLRKNILAIGVCAAIFAALNVLALIFALCGIGLIIAGGIAEYNVAMYLSKDVIELHAFVIFIIAFGGLLTITGIFGFVGACMKSVCLLTFVLNYVDKVLEEVYGTYGDPLSVKLVDLIQKNLQCCGPDGIWPVYLQQPPPASCFSPQGELYIDSCVCALDEYLRKNITAIAICGLIFTVLNILALIFAICVCMALKSEVNNPEVICDPLCGIGLIIAGSIAEYNVVTYLSNDVSNLHVFVICIIVFGVLLTIIGIFGFFGACGKNICCLTVYIMLLLLFTWGEIAVAIAGFVLKDKVLGYVDEVLWESYKTYRTGVSTNLIDLVQENLQCCGPYGHWPIYLGLAAPYSCFDKNGYLYGQGCVDALNNYIKTNIVVIAICALVFTVLNLLALIFAVCVCMALKRGDDV